MKKVVVLGVCALLSLTLAASSHAGDQDDEKSTASEYCASHGDLGLSHGACVAYFAARNVAPHDASICRDENVRRWLGADNHGQCVKRLGELSR